MQLSKTQRWTLTELRKHHDSAPTFGKFVRQYFIRFLRLAIILATGIWLGTQMESPFVQGFFVGFGLAAVTCDLYEIWRYTESWPVLSRIIEWQRVDELLALSSDTGQVA